MKKLSRLLVYTILFGLLCSNAYGQIDAKMMLINEAKKEVGEVTSEQLKEMIDDEEVIVLDVRESEQRAEGYLFSDFIPVKTISITRGNLEWEVESKIQDKESVIVTYCRNGGRGALAAQVLKKMGYKNVKNLQGGISAWAKAGNPIKTGLGIQKIAK
ncbi:hypothetical protein M947_01765 [Sulfurimonas hongkongensis]|uniref:Rhodanese domain-containing protein n=1 Tax=Sulfurimonas hongkongensis TaxID=1172190 RepID=T0KU89_9BACT|nr:rhodanese-like domain-containing protein [Sulfurimonas hongkongensis]EQB40554.1 hypothetical protein M947_01765 [Sulfurimonas hongkongensis]